MTSCSGSATTVRANSASGNGFVGEVKCVCTQVGLILTGHWWKLAFQTLLLQKQKAKGIPCCGSILSPNSGAGKKPVKTCSESLGKLSLGCDWQGNEKKWRVKNWWFEFASLLATKHCKGCESHRKKQKNKKIYDTNFRFKMMVLP